MGQMFFDIAGLTNFLIDQKEQPKLDRQPKPENVSFDDFLGFVAQKSDIDKPISDKPDLMEIFSNLSQAHPNNEFFNNANLVTFNNAKSGPPIETYEISIMPAAELKEIVNSLKIPVAIDLSQNLTPAVDLKLMINNGYAEKPAIDGIRPNAGTPAVIQPVNPEGVNQVFMAPGLSGFNNLTFTTDQLFVENQQFVEVKTTESDNTPIAIKVAVEDLRQAVKNYPDKITVQLISNSNNGSKAVTGSQLFVEGADQVKTTEAPGKYTLFDLRSLISAEDLEQINIIRKAVSLAHQITAESTKPATEIELLNSLQYDRTRSVKFNNESAPSKSDFDMAEKSESVVKSQTENIRPSLNTVRITNNISNQTNQLSNVKANLAAGDQSAAPANGEGTDSYRVNYAVKPENSQYDGMKNQGMNLSGSETLKQTIVSGSSSGQNINELNPGQQAVPKNATGHFEIKSSGPIAFKGERSNMVETAEKIIGQIRSRLAVTPEHTRMIIDLKPASLGKVRIDFKYEQDEIKALIQVENSKVKTMLDAELPRLKDELKIDNFKVEVNSNHFEQGANAQSRRSRLSRYDIGRMPNQGGADEFDENGGIAKAEEAERVRFDGTRGGMVNLFA